MHALLGIHPQRPATSEVHHAKRDDYFDSSVSTHMATPCPPPTQSEASPRFCPLSRNALSRVITSRVPEAPTGCPRAIAPPLTFNRSGSISPTGLVSPSDCFANSAEPIALRHEST